MSCSIRDNASLPIMRQISRWGVLNSRRRDELVQSEIKKLSVHPDDVRRLARQLSGGNQQKVVLAKWLLSQARILILDEQTRGVDVATKVEIYRIVSNLAERGVGILIISSELPEILGMSDRAIVMREGHVAGEFETARASEESLLACAAGVMQ
jgi:ABC-type sugar transport system ATPase subunit